MIFISTKDKLKYSAMKLVNKNGFHNTSTSKIAKNAGFSEATIYKHFSSKEELLIEVYLHIKRELSEALKIKNIDVENPEEALRSAFYNYLGFFLKNEDSLNYYLQFINSNYMNKVVYSRGVESIVDLIDLLDALAKKGVIKERPLSFYNVFVNAPILELARINVSKETGVDEKFEEEVIETILEVVFNKRGNVYGEIFK